MNILILPLVAGAIAQGLKFFIASNGQKWELRSLTAYSGMPSGHSAIVTSLALTAGLEEGFTSPIFSVSLILAIVVIRDALGIRRYLGQHGKTLNILIKDLSNDKVLEEHYPHLLEKIGHTPWQVAAGSAIGVLVSLAGHYLL